MRKHLTGKTLIAFFGGAMALSGPSVPAVAQTTDNCYEVILYCKYHQQYYGGFQQCLDYNRDTMCPPEAAAVPGGTFVAGLNTQMKDYI